MTSLDSIEFGTEPRDGAARLMVERMGAEFNRDAAKIVPQSDVYMQPYQVGHGPMRESGPTNGRQGRTVTY